MTAASTPAYRRDRRKDGLLQEHGYFVLRFLADDVGTRLSEVLDQVLRSLAHTARSRILQRTNESGRGKAASFSFRLLYSGTTMSFQGARLSASAFLVLPRCLGKHALPVASLLSHFAHFTP